VLLTCNPPTKAAPWAHELDTASKPGCFSIGWVRLMPKDEKNILGQDSKHEFLWIGEVS